MNQTDMGIVSDRVWFHSRRLLVTIGGVIVYWLGAQLPTPAVDKITYLGMIESKVSSDANPLSLTGGLSPSVFGLGVIPFLTAMLLLGLMGKLLPRLLEMSSEGPTGRLKYLVLTRRVSILIAIVSAIVSAHSTVKGKTDEFGLHLGILQEGTRYTLLHIAVLVAGYLALLVVAEYMTRHGVGNGVMILTVSSVIGQQLPGFRLLVTERPITILFYVGISLVSIALLVVAATSRHITRYYSVLPSGNSTIPDGGAHVVKVASASAGPVLFASSSLSVVALIVSILPLSDSMRWVQESLQNHSSPASLAAFGVLTVVFARFYATFGIDPVKEANDLTKSGRFIRGRAPGIPTAIWFATVSNSTSWLYAAMLIPIMVTPIVSMQLGLPYVLQGGSIIIPVLVITEVLVSNSKRLANLAIKN